MPASHAPAPIRVGTAGWSYEDWKGIVYPKVAPRGFDPLEMMASLFDTNEINSTFYRIPARRAAQEWARRVDHNPRFAFTAKLFRGFTHEHSAGAEDESAFLAAMEPLADAGRLTAVLVQFPVSFRNTVENRRELVRLLDRFTTLPLAVEFRHAGWDRADALEILGVRGAAFVNIDQPWISENLRSTDHVAPGRAYYRLHGRNAEKWFGSDTSNEERYDYLYAPKELEPFAERIREAAQRAVRGEGEGEGEGEGREGAGAGAELAPGTTARAPGTAAPPRSISGVSAILNNHFRGQAVSNAIQLQHLLTGEVVAAPDTLREAYPALSSITESLPPGSPDAQPGLFP